MMPSTEPKHHGRDRQLGQIRAVGHVGAETPPWHDHRVAGGKRTDAGADIDGITPCEELWFLDLGQAIGDGRRGRRSCAGRRRRRRSARWDNS